ncbi:NAD(P)/FAD-dependent oxidoreductase [Methylomagnum sp.]
MFIPFYVPGKDKLRVAIVGGGYSGLAALATLREHRSDAEIILIDPRAHHLKITHLHESFRRPLTDFHLPFRALESRFGVRHIQAELPLDEILLGQWNADRVLSVGEELLEFDYLLIATGAASRRLEKSAHTLHLDDFITEAGPDLLDEHFNPGGREDGHITVVGGGATGIQFLFEIAHFARDKRLPCRLRLVDADDAPLKQFNPKLGRYVEARMNDLGVDYVPNHFFREQRDGHVVLEQRDSGERLELPSELALLFVGKSPAFRLETNWFGQVMAEGKPLERVFAAGDCSRYRLPGSNTFSAQNAVRKGKLAARNILRHAGPVKLLEPYLHQELGYVISLGPTDAVGWIGLERNVVGGLPATVVKELVEAQYDLLLAGVDTYIL